MFRPVVQLCLVNIFRENEKDFYKLTKGKFWLEFYDFFEFDKPETS